MYINLLIKKGPSKIGKPKGDEISFRIPWVGGCQCGWVGGCFALYHNTRFLIT